MVGLTNEILSDLLGKKVKLAPFNTSLNPTRKDVVYLSTEGRGRFGSIQIERIAYLCKVKAYKMGYVINELGAYVLVIRDGQTLHREDNDMYECGETDWCEAFDIKAVVYAYRWIVAHEKKGGQ